MREESQETYLFQALFDIIVGFILINADFDRKSQHVENVTGRTDDDTGTVVGSL